MSILKTTEDQCTSQENAKFLDFAPAIIASVATSQDPTVNQGDYSNAELGEFLSRPVKIAERSWNLNAGLGTSFDPWHLWATNAQVKRKLDNYFNFRGTLMVKFVINGSPFHYGKLIASYQPLHNHSTVGTMSTTPDTNPWIQAIIQRSQRLHIILDASTDEGGCLCLPFLYPKNYIAIPSAATWTDMGQMSINSLQKLHTVSTSTQDVTITVFAWAVDTTIAIPTWSLAAQAGDETDEDSGIVSGPASTIAAVAGKLTTVPIIAPFAMATQIGANAVGSIAKIFGFSKPAYVGPVNSMRRDPVGTISNTYGADNVHKLTFDPKQNLTVDPRTMGLGSEDEMSLKYITQRESYLTYFDWALSNVVDDNLFWATVTPGLGKLVTQVAPLADMFQPTALAFATLPFKYWSGTLIYRFEIVASRYHKGRLRLTWDPNTLAGAQDVDNYNVNYVTIMDLEKTRNVEVPITWGIDVPYARADVDRTTNYLLDPLDGAGVTTAQDFSNGWFNISVLNELIAPAVTGTIRVNVYVRAGDDFELHCPRDTDLGSTFYLEAQSSPEEAVLENSPDGALVTNLVGEEFPDVGKKSAVFFGEPIKSFRNMLKRYNYHSTLFVDNVNAAVQVMAQDTYVVSDFPNYAGFQTSGQYLVNPGPPNVEYNPSAMTLLNYLTPAYVSMRGGLRSKYVISQASGFGTPAGVKRAIVSRDPDAGPASLTSKVYTGNTGDYPNDIITQNLSAYGPYFKGAHTTAVNQQSVLPIELPFYSP